MTQPNRITIALTAIFAGAAEGGALATIFVWLASLELSALSMFGDPANLVFIGCGLGVVVAAIMSWRLSNGIVETWRRAAISVTAAMGTVGATGGAYLVAIYSMMMMMQYGSLAKLFLPGYFLLLVGVWAAAMAIGRRSRAARFQTPAAA